MEISLTISPFIEFSGPDNRPAQETAHEAQHEDFHVIRFPQYQNDAVIAQSIAGSPVYARTYPGIRTCRHWVGTGKEVRNLEWELDWTLGWEEHAPNRGRLGTAEILGEL